MPKKSSPAEPKKTILLVEDDQFLHKVLKARLEAETPHRVVVATDGEQALDKVESAKPDLVLLDIILPKKSGFEVLAELRQQAAYKNLPVVILSNLGQQEDVAQMRQLGISDYLVKADYSLSQMVAKIKQHVHALT